MLKWDLFPETKNIILNTFQMYLDIQLSIFHPLNRQVLQATILQLFYPAVACFRTNAMMLYMMWKVIFQNLSIVFQNRFLEKSTGDVKANITRQWQGGGCMECAYGCKRSTWIVEFNSKLTSEQKMAIISSALLAVSFEFTQIWSGRILKS